MKRNKTKTLHKYWMDSYEFYIEMTEHPKSPMEIKTLIQLQLNNEDNNDSYKIWMKKERNSAAEQAEKRRKKQALQLLIVHTILWHTNSATEGETEREVLFTWHIGRRTHIHIQMPIRQFISIQKKNTTHQKQY